MDVTVCVCVWGGRMEAVQRVRDVLIKLQRHLFSTVYCRFGSQNDDRQPNLEGSLGMGVFTVWSSFLENVNTI